VALEAENPAAAAVAEALAASQAVEVEVLPADAAATALRKGRVDLVLRPSGDARGGLAAAEYEYRYDPTRPEGKSARLVTSDALERFPG
jgi:hypothetical protein